MTAEELIDYVLAELVKPVEPKKPRKKTLAQKQGARAGGRTRVRHAEGFGAIYHEYYQRPSIYQLAIDLAMSKEFPDGDPS